MVLFNELNRGTAGGTVWSDEKIFTVEQAQIAETVGFWPKSLHISHTKEKPCTEQ